MADKTKEPFSRIKSLKCHDRVYEMVVHGYPVNEIARYIQEDRREYTDIKYDSLVRMLLNYRESIVPVEAIAPRLPHYLAKKAREFGNRLEELARLEKIYDGMDYRFDLVHGQERMTGTINTHMEKLTHELRDTIMRMHDIKMDLGLSGSRDLGTLTISPEKLAQIEAKYGPEAAKAYANPVSRGRVLKVVNLAIEAARIAESKSAAKQGAKIGSVDLDGYEDIDS